MASYAWYVGSVDVRNILAADWTRMGIANTGDVVWQKSNSWSVNESSLSAGQIAWLALQPEFLTGQSTVRPGYMAVSNPDALVNQAQLVALLALKLPQPAVPLSAGQSYGSDGVGNTVAINPAELAYAENATGVTQSIASSSTAGGGNFTAVTNCQIVVPASTRPVYLEGSATVSFPAAPGALSAVTLEIVEVNNGVDTPITWSTNVPVSSQGQFNSVTVNFLPRRLGTTARTRTFNLMVGDYQVGLSVLNSAQQPSRIAAFAR